MEETIEKLLGIAPNAPAAPAPRPRRMRFSVLFFSDVRPNVTDAQKYAFMRDIALYADREGFEALYFPERHFHEFGSIYANPAVVAAHLIPQTTRIRFRTAGVSLPLHHPAEVAEWWAINDVLSGGRVDLGFGSGWARADFILAPGAYKERRQICSAHISLVQRLWRGEAVSFPGPAGELIPVRVFPRPVQAEIAVWLLVTQSEEGFAHAGRQGYNVFTMLYGNNLEAMAKKIARYRAGRAEAGLDPAAGTVTLTLHTLLLEEPQRVARAVEAPFRAYIRSALDAHLAAAAQERGEAPPSETDKARILDYAYQRYYQTGGLFGGIEEGSRMVEAAIEAGVDEIACLLDFGVDYAVVTESLDPLARLARAFSPSMA